MTQPNEQRTRPEAGYSLVEVLVASGLLAGVLLAISSLFIAGTQSVRSGRELTKAVTIANSAMEQVLAWNFERIHGFVGVDAAAESGTWSTDLANPAYAGSAEDVADMGAIADAWRERVESELQGGVLSYTAEGIGSYPSVGDDGLVAFQDCHFIRVTVQVSWVEARGRARHVTFQELVL